MIWNPRFRHEAGRNMTGTAGQQRVPAEFFERFEIPLPPLPEQRRIADILDKADAIRRKRWEAIELSAHLIESAFSHLFGHTWTNERGWRKGALEDLCDKIVDCPHSTPIYSRTQTGFFCVRSSDIQGGKIDLASTLHVSRETFEQRIRRHQPKA